nr:four-carbon acid sugar kinase family protein [Loktanella sp. SALINAS62]
MIIVADDLTGALDAAAPFAALGAVVATGPDAFQAALDYGKRIVAVSTRSRECDADTAARTVAKIMAMVPDGAALMKKVDSRLKGNIRAELRAMPGRPLLLPALPDMGRIVRDGAVQGFGVDRPIMIADVLGPQAIAPDAATKTDIAAALDADPGALPVGARGLAQVLAQRMGAAPTVIDLPLPGLMLFAIGSQDPITLAQIAALQASGLDCETAPGGQVPPGGGGLVHATDIAGLPLGAVTRRFADGIASRAAAIDALVVSGGATAEAVLDALGVHLLHVTGEALPGLPVSRDAAGRLIVTKSGGFGAPDALCRLVA